MDIMSATLRNQGDFGRTIPEAEWQTKLEAAQNVLFCKELFAQVSFSVNISLLHTFPSCYTLSLLVTHFPFLLHTFPSCYTLSLQPTLQQYDIKKSLLGLFAFVMYFGCFKFMVCMNYCTVMKHIAQT